MENRFEVRRGRFGAYFYDKTDNKDLDLVETVTFLNVLHNEHIAMSPCKLFAANMVCRLGRTYPNNDRISCGNVACQLTQPQ